jgi:vacuolar-type H+-ATPase subunit H
MIDEGASTFGGKVKIDKKESMEILNTIRLELPDAIQKAVITNEERVNIVTKAKEDAKQIIEDAKRKADQMTANHTITKSAEATGRRLVDEAEIKKKKIKNDSVLYADRVIAKVEKDMRDMMKEMEDTLNKVYRTRKELDDLKE